MATSFPEAIQTFPVMTDLTSDDINNVKNYQQAILNNNFTLAAQYLALIQNANQKLITAEYLNTINDTLIALQQFYEQKWSSAYVVSFTQPVSQEVGDFWLEVIQQYD